MLHIFFQDPYNYFFRKFCCGHYIYDLIISPGRSVVQMHLWRLDYRGEDVSPGRKKKKIIHEEEKT